MFQLNLSQVINERGNTWLTNGESHVFWHDNGDGTWLEITVTPENSPGFYIGLVETTEEKLRQHIAKECEGWWVKRCNISDVQLDENYAVAGVEDAGD